MPRRLWAALVRACAYVLSRWADRVIIADRDLAREDIRERDHRIRMLESQVAMQANEIVSLALRCEREAERFRADITALKAQQLLVDKREE